MIALLGMGLADLLCWLIVIPTLVVVTYRALINSEDRRTLLAKLGFSFLLVLSMFWIGSMHAAAKPLWLIIPCALLGTMWVSNALDILVKPFTATFDGGTDEVEAKPFYYIAEGKRRKGLYEEAAGEVRKQLEKFPGDVEGMMKLAAIKAEDLHDLPAAAATLNELLQQPGLLPNHAVAALQTLADWQMNLGRDPAAARASFERIMQMFPDSSYSHTAEQRIAHLEGVSHTRHLRENAVFKVPSGERGLGLRKTAGQAESPAVAADALAAEYVSQLEKYPNDTDTREKLALVYAEEFERVDLAVSQLEQLAALPNETPQHIAHWLGLLATVHIRHGHDMEAAEDALRRIIDRFPKSAVATRAVARLATLQAELKTATTTTAAKALGVYEKDVGLKSHS
jgi:outer membrane protein assembly factor BamD (BamD/ComL family)